MKNIEHADIITREIINSCGGQTFLHIGSGSGQVVQTLLSLGMDAQGVDESAELVAQANNRMPNRFSQASPLQLPFADRSIDTTIAIFSLENVQPEHLAAVIKEINRVTRRSLYLRIATVAQYPDDERKTIQDRDSWERLLFDGGFRKHPSYYLINNYEALGRESGEATILLERVSVDAIARYPLEALKEERDLHMDMTREAGERSDAHIARYQWAASFVRPGDTVLDAACGLGYGSYLLQCGTMAARTIGIDGSDYAIDYANVNFAPEVGNLSFEAGMLPQALERFADSSVDVVISFETLEHISDPESVLKEFHRILTPAGRVIVSVPNDWSDETGEDPNPFHLHVYTLNKLRQQVSAHFDLEDITVQSATHYKKTAGSKEWIPAKREIYSIDAGMEESEAPPSEWWLAVGMKSPLVVGETSYRETQHKTYTTPGWNVTEFARDYKNPWLVRGMVDIGGRQKNKARLNQLTEHVYTLNQDNSADAGAALCVQGYQLLNNISALTQDVLDVYAQRVDAYVQSGPVTPHAVRWKISLYFVLAKLWLNVGLHAKAKIAFERCVAENPLQFSPLLANRVVESCLYLGILNLNVGAVDAARDAWLSGISSAQKALSANWQQSLGDVNDPVEFGLPELSSVLDYASNCAYALVNLDSFKDKPWWWQQLQRSPHAQASSQARLSKVLNDQLVSLSAYAASLEENISLVAGKDATIETQCAAIAQQNATMSELMMTLQLKDQAIAEQAASIHQLNAIMQTRLMRLRNVMLYQPWSARKVMHMAYLSISLATPRALRHKMQPLTRWLRARFAQRATVNSGDSTTAAVPESNGYRIKMPVTKPDAPKIAHVIANFMTGGSSRLVVDLVEYLGHDYEQFVLTSYAPNPPAYLGMRIEEQRDCNDITPFVDYFKRTKPDFIHVHYWGDVDEPWYAKAIEAANVLNIPVIENINTPIAPHINDAVKRYVYVSDYVRHVFGRADDSHVTIYPGSDFSHFMRNDNEAVPQDCVGMVYRLEGDKLNEQAIKPFIAIALKRPQTKILIVGGGSLLAPFQDAVRTAGVAEQFEFTGYVEYDTLPDYYRQMSLFIAPVWKESFGQVSPFAMNMRVPVIGYDVGAISEIVNSKTMLAPAGDAEKLADIAVRLLDDDELRATLGREHQQRAEGLFSVQAMISAYAELYAEMAKK